MKKLMVMLIAAMVMSGGIIIASQPAMAAPIVPGSAGIIGLTWDDGPDPKHTQIILAVLKATKTKATFFLEGSQVKKYPGIAKQIQLEGHTIGNHGWDHQDFSGLTYEQAKKSINDTNIEIEKATGYRPILFRYPFGNESTSGNQAIRDLGMWGGVLWHWTHNPPRKLNANRAWVGDWVCKNSQLAMADYVEGNAVDQGIILLHDAGDAGACNISHTGFLWGTIDRLRAKGYEFGTVAIAFKGSPVNEWSWVQVVK